MNAIELSDELSRMASIYHGQKNRAVILAAASELRRLAAVEQSLAKLTEYLSTFHPVGMVVEVTTANVCQIAEEEIRRLEKLEVTP
jgi:hypothetical protein